MGDLRELLDENDHYMYGDFCLASSLLLNHFPYFSPHWQQYPLAVAV